MAGNGQRKQLWSSLANKIKGQMGWQVQMLCKYSTKFIFGKYKQGGQGSATCRSMELGGQQQSGCEVKAEQWQWGRVAVAARPWLSPYWWAHRTKVHVNMGDQCWSGSARWFSARSPGLNVWHHQLMLGPDSGPFILWPHLLRAKVLFQNHAILSYPKCCNNIFLWTSLSLLWIT